MSRILFVVWFCTLTGCATPITTWVAVHNNNLQDLEANKTYSVVPYGGQEQSSGFRQYESLVKQELAKHGFVDALPENESSFKNQPRTGYSEPRVGYSASSYNYNATHQLPVVLPALIEALFVDFPNQIANPRNTMRCIN
ncbi:MAG: hypothetical protein Q7J84_07165 [Sulfuricaulis sp.]|nr:hypothetical protein [Sulfuricaulis sp.]